MFAAASSVTRERAAAALAVGLAAPIGVLAVVSPRFALAAVVSIVFVATAVADLAAGLAVFVTVTFFALIPGIGTSFVSVVKLAGAVLLLALGRKKGLPSLFLDHPLLASLAVAMGVWAFASALWAPDVAHVRGRALTLVLGVVLVFVVYGAIREPKHARWLVRGYIAGAVLSALVGLFVTSPTATDPTRLSGGIGDPNELALVLVPGLALAFFAIPGARSEIERWLLVLSAGAIALALFQTGSRGGLVALAAAFVAAMLFGGSRRPHVLAGLLGLTALGVAYFVLAAPSAVTARVLHFTAAGGSGRTDLWAIAQQVAQDHPIVGIGIGNFEDVEAAYASRTTNLPAVDIVVDNPHVVHNSYLEVLAEQGIVGLVLFAAFLVGALTLGWRAVRAFTSSGDTDLELIARGVLVALVGMLAASVFLSAEYEKQLWLLLGLSIALTTLTRARSSARPA